MKKGAIESATLVAFGPVNTSTVHLDPFKATPDGSLNFEFTPAPRLAKFMPPCANADKLPTRQTTTTSIFFIIQFWVVEVVYRRPLLIID